MTTQRIAVLAASVRGERMGRLLAEWAADRAGGHLPTGEIDLIDLAECTLPDDALLQPGGSPATDLTDRLDRADGFVIVTPEYNHSYPASLKRVIDWHYREWMFKPATVLSYGTQGGLLATEHLRGVFAELHVVVTRRAVGISTPWYDLDSTGYAAPPPVVKAFDTALGELGWWAETLRSARHDRPYYARR